MEADFDRLRRIQSRLMTERISHQPLRKLIMLMKVVRLALTWQFSDYLSPLFFARYVDRSTLREVHKLLARLPA